MTKLSPLASVSQTRAVLEAHGLTAKYSFGQNFLVNDAIVEKIAGLADLSPGDSVLEVGPGIGTLTIALLKRAGRVVSVERDADLLPVLADTLEPWWDRFALVSKDALDLSPGDLPFAPTKLVANLPYAVAATVVLDYFERFPSLESATVMVQKEVADRMAAQPGSKTYGAYTVKLRLFAQPSGRFPVGPGNFFPQPRVESAVVRLDRRPLLDDAGAPLDATVVRAAGVMADAAFATRRKTLANSCKTYFAGRADVGSSRGGRARDRGDGCAASVDGAGVVERLPQLFELAGIDPRRRGETLDLAEFVRLGQALLEIA